MKKRRRRSKEKKSFLNKYHYLISGILLVLVSVLAIGPLRPLGAIGKIGKIAAVFLVGKLNILLLIFLFLLGIYLIFQKDKKERVGSGYKIFGLFIFLIGLLVIFHSNYLKVSNYDSSKVLFNTVEDLKNYTLSLWKSSSITAINGGGILGGLLVVLFNKLFSKEGTMIVVFIFLIVGFLLFTGFSLKDMVLAIIEKRKNRKSKEKSEDDDSYSQPLIEKLKKEKDKEKDKDNDQEEEKEKDLPYIKSKEELESSALEIIKKKDLENACFDKGANKEGSLELEKEKKVWGKYILPSIDLLKRLPTFNGNKTNTITKEISILETSLEQFGIIAKVIDVHSGPSVTQYEMKVKPGTKLSRILGVTKELSLALAKKDVRIEAPIPGKDAIGIEVANDNIESVGMREILEQVPTLSLKKQKNKLLVVLGKNIMGEAIFYELNEAPHLLVAGATGSGKSVCINTIIISLLMRNTPDELKLVLIDPKKVEFSAYENLPHLLGPVVNNPKVASETLKKLVKEMEERFNLFEKAKVKNIEAYNQKYKGEKLPLIVCIIDELADLMMVASKDVQDSIMRITQMARAAGIHLIVATQRPSTDIITGIVKSNIPSRISFAVSSSIDSRTILDRSGAEKLLGKGDMLFKPLDQNNPMRIQGAFVSDEEIISIVSFIKKQREVEYDQNFEDINVINDSSGESFNKSGNSSENKDDLYQRAIDIAVHKGTISISFLQRRLKIGYNKAAEIVEQMEEEGIVGEQVGSKPRKVLIKPEEDDE